MALFGKTLSDYVRFQRVLLILTVAVGLLRVGFSLGGVPSSIVAYFSMTALLLVGVVYYPVRVQSTGFGGYRHVLVLLVIQFAASSVITAGGISLTALTGVANIFHGDPSGQLGHAVSHLVGGPTIFALVFSLPSALILFVAKKLSRQSG